MTRRVTLQTIADRLGVSRTTVSNAYNRPDQLTDALRHRILATADQLGYRGPDAAARMLRTGHMGAIGLLFTEDLRFVFTDPDTTLFMQGVAETSALAGTGLILLPVPPGLDVTRTAVVTAAVDGYLVFSVADRHPALEPLRAREVPIVVVDEPDLGSATSFVGIDDRAGARLAADHLVSLGHRRIGVLLGRATTSGRSQSLRATDVADSPIRIVRERSEGYLEGLRDAGLAPKDILFWEAGGHDPDAGRHATADLLRDNPEVTGLLCFADQLAIGAIQAATSAGRAVPEDLAVVGFDDIPRAANWDPPLTTVRQPLVDKGRLAAELLLDEIENGIRRRVELPIELVVRESTASP